MRQLRGTERRRSFLRAHARWSGTIWRGELSSRREAPGFAHVTLGRRETSCFAGYFAGYFAGASQALGRMSTEKSHSTKIATGTSKRSDQSQAG